MTDTTILHLTDLHFGCEADSTRRAERELILTSLIEEVGALEPTWKPHLVCVTGDIGWAGKPDDYAKAEAWLKTLLDRLSLTFADVLVCAGNHDTSRDVTRTIGRPANAMEADAMLRPPIAGQYEDTFAAFTKFCKRVGIRAYTFEGAPSYLVGETECRGIRFVGLNSAWFCKGADDQGKLWVGQPHLKLLEAAGRIGLTARPGAPPTVALVHHPPDWWHADETHAYAARPNTRDYLAQRCHLILTGHTHAEVRKADRIAGGALHLTGGASYADAAHFNTFRLARLESGRFVYRSFEFDPRSAETKWSDRWGAQALPFDERPPDASGRVAVATPAVDRSALRTAAERDARRTIELKSRLLKGSGTLPEPFPLRVEMRVSPQLDQYDPSGGLQVDPRQVTSLPLYEACRLSRRTVLLGDLGSGKSTLASLLVLQTLERDPDALAFLIPAKGLRLPEEFRLDDLLTACGEYVSAQVAVCGEPCNLRGILEEDVELTLVIDGLDEVARPQAARLLRHLPAITDCWPNAQVVAIGRPIELAGVSYASWGLCRLGHLGDSEKEAIFRAEAIADGSGPGEAAETAKRRLGLLKRHPMLDEMASTVLAVRLLYPRLQGAVDADAQSIGDLLYDLLIGRLGAWAEQELKRSPYEQFENRFPTPEQRAELLGTLALAGPERSTRTREAAEQLFLPHTGGDLLVARQALAFFEQAGLLSLTAQVEFPFQPLAETAAATAMLALWARREGPKPASLAARWRTAAFAAALARRRDLTHQVRPQILRVVNALLQSAQGVPAACMIASESRDPEAAVTAIEGLRRLGRKPLRWFGDERFASNHAIAQTIRLAGERGFDWFLAEYLDARTPIIHRGSAVVDEVFAHWAWLSRETIGEGERSRLRPLVGPLLAGSGLFELLPGLAFTVPDAFSDPERLWYVAAFLDQSLFGEEAATVLAQAADARRRPLVQAILKRYAERSRRASPLYLRLFPEEGVPPCIARGILRWWATSPDDQAIGEALEACNRSLGEAAWGRFLRWSLTDGERTVAAGAALLLHRSGERRVQILGAALLEALHDGGYVRRAEEVLGELLEQDPERSLHWLADRLGERRGLDGGHSGWWRLFLRLLDPDRPHSPDLLRRCMAGIGPFLLPRYPEVRDRFSRLLSGSSGERFRQALRAQLWHGDPQARHGAAAVLVTCDPGGEGEALYATVATRGETASYDHEWEAFCLSLAFGPTVLEGLHTRLDQLNQAGRAFALAILHRHGYALSAPEREEFYGYLLDLKNWSFAPAPSGDGNLAVEEWFAFLRRILAQPIDERGRRAANRLLHDFQEQLTPEERAKCRIWASLGRTHEEDLLREEIARMLEDEAYRTGLRPVFADVARFLGHPCVLERAAEAATDPAAWQEVTWSLLSDTICMEAEEGGHLLLEFGRDQPQHAAAIGAAATALLRDGRLADQHRPEVRQWLTLLAHEFGSLPLEEVRSALLAGSPISWAAARALMARLGEVPAALPRRQYPGDFPEDLRNPPLPAPESEATPLDALLAYGRAGGTPHPETCAAVERLLCSPAVDEADLRRIARQGVPGIFIAETVRFCAGLPPSIEDRLPLILNLGSLHRLREDQCFGRLREHVILAHDLALEDGPTRGAYVRLLDERLSSRTDRIAPLARELLRYRGTLHPEQLRPVVEEFALEETIFQVDLGIALLRWVARLRQGPMVEPVANAVEHGVRILWERGPIVRGEARSPYPLLLLPLMVWALRQRSEEASIGLYWWGMRLLFSGYRHEGGRADALGLFDEVAPLLPRIPQPVWDAIRTAGAAFEDPTVRSLLALLAGFTGGATATAALDQERTEQPQ